MELERLYEKPLTTLPSLLNNIETNVESRSSREKQKPVEKPVEELKTEIKHCITYIKAKIKHHEHPGLIRENALHNAQ
ncbi:MAG: hypothetical protein QXV30_01070 [Desulfurococcaceae archaeon]